MGGVNEVGGGTFDDSAGVNRLLWLLVAILVLILLVLETEMDISSTSPSSPASSSPECVSRGP